MANRLAHSLSPYLRQHADNPVDWWEWGDDAFVEAARRDVPVLLSVGYAACHWCHVMAHESFEDADTAAGLNDRFVAIKVDREERPDVDAVYMAAVQGLTGQGGWPMTVFLTPTGEPFYAGTYYPPEPRHGMPSFRQVLDAVAEAWTDRRDGVVEQARAIAGAIGADDGGAVGARRPIVAVRASEPALDAAALDAAAATLAAEFDARHGGFGGAPKFPPSMALELLLRHHARTGDDASLAMVASTCEHMARGGIHDQLAGGFARYSVDATWAVPHFEKMLYDNAQLLRLHAHLHRSAEPGGPTAELARRVATSTAEFLLRDLRTGQGAFASALDADAPAEPGGRPEEGVSYVWTPVQLVDVLGEDDGAWAAAALGVTEAGTFEGGASTLRLPADPDDGERWLRVRATLLAARDTRPQPARDDKVVAAWNGLAIAALAEAGALLDRPDWVDAAVACAELLVNVHLDDGRLRRVSRDGVPGTAAGVLEDYADVADGFLALLQATGDPVWLTRAGALLDVVLDRFAAPGGGFFDTADDATDPRLATIRRPADPSDNAAPSGSSAAAGALLSYAALTGSRPHRAAAEAALAAVAPLAERAPRFAGWALAVAEAALAGPAEVAVVGPGDDPRTHTLLAAARGAGAPGAVVVAADPDDLGADAVPLLRDRPLLDGAPAAYVCRQFVCARPTGDPDELVALLDARHSPPSA
ncbi:protein of unknown function DUF255 [Beutenbergia cavernae DSM 12333]|uniref:Spermatogenesis-associated protein 20-like TRX domain-containing protein n=1 Tax=Beutenbergia cavernae (strain ATCC BAA-8 / DSM 12333 / CCUG 43141 / JCM 11478 / NBRC 16432 / NCIMB 13614 / HKI 0122) TaxID=471853 RepID=C5C3N8_BEUC1|nr:thioredoxin domain-containing protein [Beutenbergia cavernae]ACQ81947.1 protein of unknown function DUF255 [Beutenbergia cavernae DSM 12333]